MSLEGWALSSVGALIEVMYSFVPVVQKVVSSHLSMQTKRQQWLLWQTDSEDDFDWPPLITQIIICVRPVCGHGKILLTWAENHYVAPGLAPDRYLSLLYGYRWEENHGRQLATRSGTAEQPLPPGLLQLSYLRLESALIKPLVLLVSRYLVCH
jgi:hypothetical protein